MRKHCYIYTDGACSGNPGDGGIAYLILDEEKNVIKEFSQYFPNTTNNRMELLAVISAIKTVKGLVSEVTVYSDSAYVVKAVNNKWLDSWVQENFLKRKNADLWRMFVDVSQNIDINFVLIKGHSDNLYNNKCDLLAKRAIRTHKLY